MSRRLAWIGAATAVTVGVATYVVLGGSMPSGGAAARPLADVFAEITKSYGVEVRWQIEPGFFPAEWSEVEPNAEPIAESELRRMPAILAAALAKYPPDFVRKNLHRICLARDLSFAGTPFGGTYDRDSVYMCNEGAAEGFDDVYLIGTLHHEFSSILMHNYGFDVESWRRCNPEGFEYTAAEGGGVKAIENAEDGLEGAPEYYEKGLLSQYAKSELEEDYNTYCEVMMTEPSRLRELAEQYPVIARKYELCRAFYGRLGIDVR